MYEEYLRLAKNAAGKAGEFLLKRQNINVDGNYARDIKLSSDKESERIIIDSLSSSGLPILSEECGLLGKKDEKQSLCWIVDPLDGTVNYYKGIEELCGISIALFDGDTPVLGVVNRFACNELFSGIVGRGAFLNGTPIKTSTVEKLSETVIATGFPAGRSYSDDSLTAFVRRVQGVKKVRMLGAAAIMSAFVANGRVDAYYEESIRLWDIAGAMAVVTAAGGAVRLVGKEDYKCDFGAFATEKLKEEFYEF